MELNKPPGSYVIWLRFFVSKSTPLSLYACLVCVFFLFVTSCLVTGLAFLFFGAWPCSWSVRSNLWRPWSDAKAPPCTR